MSNSFRIFCIICYEFYFHTGFPFDFKKYPNAIPNTKEITNGVNNHIAILKIMYIKNPRNNNNDILDILCI